MLMDCRRRRRVGSVVYLLPHVRRGSLWCLQVGWEWRPLAHSLLRSSALALVLTPWRAWSCCRLLQALWSQQVPCKLCTAVCGRLHLW